MGAAEGPRYTMRRDGAEARDVTLWYMNTTGWWFSGLEHSLFSHMFGRIIPIDFHFSEGWLNHQPDNYGKWFEIGGFFH